MTEKQAAEYLRNKLFWRPENDTDTKLFLAGYNKRDEELRQTPQAAGPVWVNTVDRNPPADYKGDMRVVKHSENGPWYSQWLDESVPPSFTPDQIENAFYAACNMINRHLGEKAVSIETVKKLHKEYMNTNFPNSKT